MGELISLKTLEMEKQYAQYYQKCSNFDFFTSEVICVPQPKKDIHKELVSGYMHLLTNQINS